MQAFGVQLFQGLLVAGQRFDTAGVVRCNDEHFAKYLPDYASLDELKAHYQRSGLGDVKVKKFLNNVLQETLEPIRNRREELEKDPGYVMDVLRQGTQAAQAAAADTLAKVKHAMQIDYFA